MPGIRELLLAIRANRDAYDAWRAAVEELAYGVIHESPRGVDNKRIVESVHEEARGTPSLLFSSEAATLAAMYMLGYGKNRDIVASKMMEIRLTA